MGKGIVFLSMMAVTCTALADGLPGITGQPKSLTLGPGQIPGQKASFTVGATNATGFQWRFNGVDIPGATNATLQITNPKPANSGYYLALATNTSGWVPSQLAYLSVVKSGSFVPLSNLTNTGFYAQARDLGDNPINDAFAEVLAGPTLDQMVPTGDFASVTDGYFDLEQDTGLSSTFVGNVDPGQTLYYRVAITSDGTTITQESRVLKLTAGDGGTFPIPSTGNLQFISIIGWPQDPYIDPMGIPTNNQVAMLGANFGLVNEFGDNYYIEFGLPTWQWRKDGVPIGSPQLFDPYDPSDDLARGIAGLSITNAQPADAGIYDLILLGENWYISPMGNVSVQIVNGSSIFQTPRLHVQATGELVFDTQMVLLGAPGRVFQIQSSSDLSTWNNLMLVTNVNGGFELTQPLNPTDAQFYRAMILPP